MIEVKYIKTENKAAAYDGDVEIGKCEFEVLNDTWNIVHTVVDNQYRGQGIAKKLVQCVKENAEKYHKQLTASCSYAKKVLGNSDN